MAYKKGKGYKKRRTFKKRVKPMRYQVADMAYNAYKGVSYLKSLINIETKYSTYTLAPTNITSVGTVLPLVFMAQGATQGQRVGDSVKLQKLEIHGAISASTGAPVTNLRFILFRGRLENTTVPSVADLLESGNIFDAKTFRDRFRTRVLYDKMWTFSGANNVGAPLIWNFKLGWHTNFVPASTTIEDGGLYLLMISDKSANYPSAEFTSRVYYTDD